MKLSSYEAFLVHDKAWNEERRQEVNQQFPYIAILEGAYPEHDFSHRWCWQQFGEPEYKQCHDHGSEYPCCPLVLATEYKTSYIYEGKECFEKNYRQPEKHGHSGNWTTVWLGKTGYDYGFSEYCFLSEKARDTFILSPFSLGENYD